MPKQANYNSHTVFGKPNWPRELLPSMKDILKGPIEHKSVEKPENITNLKHIKQEYLTENMKSYSW